MLFMIYSLVFVNIFNGATSEHLLQANGSAIHKRKYSGIQHETQNTNKTGSKTLKEWTTPDS